MACRLECTSDVNEILLLTYLLTYLIGVICCCMLLLDLLMSLLLFVLYCSFVIVWIILGRTTRDPCSSVQSN